MADQYGLVTTQHAFGTGSFYSPPNTTKTKALRIDPGTAYSFGIYSGQDFIISARIKYNNQAFSRYSQPAGTRYPIIKYGGLNEYAAPGWEFGLVYARAGDSYAFYPYFGFSGDDGQRHYLEQYYNGQNATGMEPSGNFDSWEVKRSNGVITFTFSNGRGSPQVSTLSYTGDLARVTQILVDLGYLDSSYSGIYIGSEQYGPNSNWATVADPGAYIDELFMARNVSTIQNIDQNDGSINDGKLDTTVFLYHFDGNYYDITTQQVYVTANLTSTSNLVSHEVYTKYPQTSEVAISSTSSIHCIVTKSFSQQRPYSVQRKGYTPSLFYDSVHKEYNQSIRLPGYNYVTGTGAYLQIGNSQNDSTGVYYNNFFISNYSDFYISFWTDSNLGLSYRGGNQHRSLFLLAHAFGTAIDIGLVVPNGGWWYAYAQTSLGNITISQQYYDFGYGPTQWILKRVNGTLTLTVNGVSNSISAPGAMLGSFIQLGYGAAGGGIPVSMDEVFFAIGAGSVYSVNAQGEIADGNLPTTQLLLHFNNDLIDDMSGVQSLDPTTLYSGTYLTANTVEIKQFPRTNLTVTSTQTTTISKVKLFQASIVASGFMVVSPIRLRQGIATLRVFSTELTVVAKTTRDFADLHSSSTQVATTRRIRGFAESVTATSTLTTLNYRSRGVQANFATFSNVYLNVQSLKLFRANLATTSRLTVQDIKQATDQAHLNSTTQLTEVTNRIRSIQVSLQAFTSELTVDRAIKTVQANLTATTTFVCRTGIEAKLYSTSTMTVSGKITRSVTGNFSDQTTLVSSIQRQRVGQGNFACTSSLNANIHIAQIVRGISTQNSTSSLIAIGKIAQIVRGTSRLQSQFTISAAAGKSRVDTTLVWFIEPEDRDWLIEYEERKWDIPSEN